MVAIMCKKCNEKFKNMIDMVHHICLKETTNGKVNWSGKVGRNANQEASKALRDYPAWLSEESKKHLRKIKEDKLDKLEN